MKTAVHTAVRMNQFDDRSLNKRGRFSLRHDSLGRTAMLLEAENSRSIHSVDADFLRLVLKSGIAYL